MLQGKGLWAYRKQELDDALRIASQIEATHILYKVGQGPRYYEGMAQIAQRIEGAGLIPFAWVWLTLEDPQAEAQVAVRALQDGFEGFIFDTEAKECRGRFEQAVQLGEAIHAAGLDPNKFYNCSFPNISHHRDLPYDQLNKICKGGLMPMSYGTLGYSPGLPVDQHAHRVIDEWTYGHYEYWSRRWGYRPPLYPTLAPYHDEHGQNRMSPDELRVWLDRLGAHRPTFFRVFRAGVLNDDLLPLLKDFALPEEGTAPPALGGKVEVVSPQVGYLNLRPTPSTDRLPIAQLDDGTVLEALEPEDEVRAKVGRENQWLHIWVPDGPEGYAAAWYLRPYEEGQEPTLQVVVTSPTGFLNVRPTRSTEQPPIAKVDDGAVLGALEPEAVARARLGQEGRWLRVRTPDGVEGYVAAWYLQLPEEEEEEVPEAATRVEVVSPTLGFLNVRPAPSTDQSPIARVDDGVVLEALEPEAEVRAKVGEEGEWLRVRTPDGVKGYVAAWYLRLFGKEKEKEKETGEKAGLKVEVVSPEVGFLNVRPEPSTDKPAIAQVDDGTVLEALEPDDDVRAKVGQEGQWLRIRTPRDIEGYVAAWYLSLSPEGEVGKPISHLVVHSSVGLNVRPAPGQPPIWRVPDRTTLEVREDPKKVGSKLGKDRWIRVRTPSRREGVVNGLYVREKRLGDKRQPVDDAILPRGECAWIFGIHAAGATTPADFRFLFQRGALGRLAEAIGIGSHKTGWVLFTEAIGSDPNHGGGHDYTPWSQDGYGVIVRLNNGYEPAGTLPVSTKYPDFAQACARYVENSRGCHIWIIGNEQNNVREHPGGAQNPTEHITPQKYARAFNLARERIKAVQPGAIVVPGAVDPYNTAPWKLMGNRRYRPLDYFKEMLGHIADLDGIALHTYTHWMSVELITKKTVFTDPPLTPNTPHEHYYGFQAYRSFAEAIPAKWSERPIYITESNHWLALEHEPRNKAEQRKIGWVNKNKGWVRAAYEEIDRWNNTPHAQQIQCLLLYRWIGDEWAIKDKGEIHKDFREALKRDRRWRR